MTQTHEQEGTMFKRLFDTGRSITSITVQEAWERVTASQTTTTLIDVRETWEFKHGHARGARNIPLSQLGQRFREVPADRDILLICRSGHRSLQAAKFLQARGWERVTNVSGGMVSWQMHRLPEG
jgi:rhodanese-related sulfurtransferase